MTQSVSYFRCRTVCQCITQCQPQPYKTTCIIFDTSGLETFILSTRSILSLKTWSVWPDTCFLPLVDHHTNAASGKAFFLVPFTKWSLTLNNFVGKSLVIFLKNYVKNIYIVIWLKLKNWKIVKLKGQKWKVCTNI